MYAKVAHIFCYVCHFSFHCLYIPVNLIFWRIFIIKEESVCSNCYHLRRHNLIEVSIGIVQCYIFVPIGDMLFEFLLVRYLAYIVNTPMRAVVFLSFIVCVVNSFYGIYCRSFVIMIAVRS